MPATLHVHLLPALTSPGELRGGTVVVIDVLRASTTITHAIAAGAACVIPVLEVDEAQQLAATFPPGTAMLGGERHATPIPGFDLGNSPEDYRPDTVGGKTVIFTTTNGTKAMQSCRQAERVLIGSFVNRRAIVNAVCDAAQLHLLCAGTSNKVTREDVLFAGAIVAALDDQQRELNDSAAVARDAWRWALGDHTENPTPDQLVEMFVSTQGGRNLHRVGLADDLKAAAQLDRFDLLPELDLAQWRITAAV